jgi:DmsE family decaheme c-type cytochrome
MNALRLGFSLAVVLLMAGGPPAAAGVAGEPQATSIEDCKACHEPAVNGIARTSHGALAQSCSSCHGDTTEHLTSNLEKGEPGPIKKLTTAKAAEVNQTCLGCHEKGNQANWSGSMHDRRDVACTSCHSVHSFRSERAHLKTRQDAETCFGCHQQMRAKSLRTSHHPVREGKLDCASCHNPHDGSRPKMIKADWTTDLCLTCHTEKRGPFLWEHAPVLENCALCHDPHGSNHDKMLVAKQPFLCQRCHLNTRHPGTLYDAGNTLAGKTSGPSGTPTVSNRAVEHACKNCHQNVHGGNAPSGPYLGR